MEPEIAVVGASCPECVTPGEGIDDWCQLVTERLPVGRIADWVVRPNCGAITCFTGTVRDHSPGRVGVTELEYEAYEEVASRHLRRVVADTRSHWPDLGRVAAVHRLGRVSLSEAAVVVAVSAPHRDEAFAAARYLIDEVKAQVPIWKREVWVGGAAWGTCDQHVPAQDASEFRVSERI